MPEYSLTAQNQITTVHFHPTDPFFVFGSTMNGQILMWDVRNGKSKPMQRSNFAEGHSAPVFDMSFLPNIKLKQAEIAKQKGVQKQNKMETGNVHHILSVSNDGKLCIWRTDQLSVKPQNVVDPAKDQQQQQNPTNQRQLITTCFDYSYRDHQNVILGSDEGYLYKAEIISSGGQNQKASTIKEAISAHFGPITNVEFFPINQYEKAFQFNEKVSGLYLTSSYDWTVKLWHNKFGTKLGKQQNGPFAVFDQMTDYVYDVKWNIGGKPGVFACCDGEGKINVFDLSEDFRHPVTKTPIKINKGANVAATTLSWSSDGKFLAGGDSDGTISFYNVHRTLMEHPLSSYEALQAQINRYIWDENEEEMKESRE